MKKIIFTAVLKPADDAVAAEHIKKALSLIGSAYFPNMGEVEVGSTEGMKREVWIFKSDSEDAYQLVKAQGDCQGREIGEEELEGWQRAGVCVEMHVEYPNAQRNGAPMYVACEDFAELTAGEHGFAVPYDGFVFTHSDRGDDGAYLYWFKLALPE